MKHDMNHIVFFNGLSLLVWPPPYMQTRAYHMDGAPSTPSVIVFEIIIIDLYNLPAINSSELVHLLYFIFVLSYSAVYCNRIWLVE